MRLIQLHIYFIDDKQQRRKVIQNIIKYISDSLNDSQLR